LVEGFYQTENKHCTINVGWNIISNRKQALYNRGWLKHFIKQKTCIIPWGTTIAKSKQKPTQYKTRQKSHFISTIFQHEKPKWEKESKALEQWH